MKHATILAATAALLALGVFIAPSPASAMCASGYSGACNDTIGPWGNSPYNQYNQYSQYDYYAYPQYQSAYYQPQYSYQPRLSRHRNSGYQQPQALYFPVDQMYFPSYMPGSQYPAYGMGYGGYGYQSYGINYSNQGYTPGFKSCGWFC